MTILDNAKKLQKKQTKIYKLMKKIAIRIPVLALMASIGLLVGSVSCSGSDIVTVDAVEMVSPSTSLLVDEELQLSRIISPPNANNQDVLWFTTDKTVAAINSRGKVVGVAPGEAIITCASQEDPSINDVLTLRVLDTNE